MGVYKTPRINAVGVLFTSTLLVALSSATYNHITLTGLLTYAICLNLAWGRLRTLALALAAVIPFVIGLAVYNYAIFKSVSVGTLIVLRGFVLASTTAWFVSCVTPKDLVDLLGRFSWGFALAVAVAYRTILYLGSHLREYTDYLKSRWLITSRMEAVKYFTRILTSTIYVASVELDRLSVMAIARGYPGKRVSGVRLGALDLVISSIPILIVLTTYWEPAL